MIEARAHSPRSVDALRELVLHEPSLIAHGNGRAYGDSAIVADVHGRNHHKDGSFRACVDWTDLMRPDAEIRRCSRQDDAILFDHTLGGVGPTSIILRTAIRLRPVETAWTQLTSIVAPKLKAAMAAFEAAQDATYSVA